MLRYFIIRDSEPANNVLAIHKVIDAAQLWFMKAAQDGGFKGTLDMVCVEVNDHGAKQTEVLLYTYEKGDVAVTVHALVNGGCLVPF
jgi:hypothetical protein